MKSHIQCSEEEGMKCATCCSDYLLEDCTMARVDELLKGVDARVEVEILQFAA
jgi:hypothetical protein